MAQAIKDAIGSATTNKAQRKVLVGVADSVTRFANVLKLKLAAKASGWLNPISWLKEFYAPTVAEHLEEWRMVEGALVGLRDLIQVVPSDEGEPLYTEQAKESALYALSTVQTVYQFQSDDSAQLNKALSTLEGDLIRLPTLAVKLVGAAIEIPANALLNQAQKTLWQMLSEFVKAAWWLIALVVLAIVGYVYVVKSGGFAALVAKAA